MATQPHSHRDLEVYQSKPMKNNSSTFPPKVNKAHALALLVTLQDEIHKSTEKRDRAVVWGKDVQGLTFKEMQRALNYNSHVTVHDIYHKTKEVLQHE